MASCEIRRQHGIRQPRDSELRWVCRGCLEILESPENAVHTEVIEVARKRQVAPFVMPVAGLAFVLAVLSEVLFYWH